MKKNILVTPPIENEEIILSKPETVAAGAAALTSSFKHIAREGNATNCSKSLFSLNQVNGYDCPGCAWPDPDDAKDRSALGEYCENGVKAVAEETTAERVTPDFFQQHSIEEMSHWSDYKIGKSGRLTHPMILKEGSSHYEKISWEDAFSIIAKELNGLASPNEAIFYTSGRTSNEAAFLYQLFVRQYGTNNMPDCSNMCHESSGVALSETVGIGKGSVRLEDFYITDLIIVIGQNPGTNHPRMLSALQKAKKAGAKIISINPLKETGLIKFKHPQHPKDMLFGGTTLTDLYLQVKINEDVALLKAILKMMVTAENAKPGSVFDHDFIKNSTKDIDDFLIDLEKENLEELIAASGVSKKEIQKAADLIARKKKIIICWAMGLTQHKNGVDNIREVVNLLLLKGSIGKPGAGTCPVRGHSNVQGDRTMGIWEILKPDFAKKLKENFDFNPPTEHGYNTVQAIKAMGESKAKIFFAMGGNFLSATPDTEYTAKALQNCSMTVQVSTKLNRSHLVTGKTAIILPCLGRTEIDTQEFGNQFVTVENSMGIVHQSNGGLEPASTHLKSEPAIVAELATATLKHSKVDWMDLIEDYDRIRDVIEKTIPGFDNYNERVRNEGGFYLPNGARDGDFKTATGKANFTINKRTIHKLKKNEFLMMTIRSHDQFNTTIYGLDDRYRGIKNGRRVVLMNAEDAKEFGVKNEGFVDLSSTYEGEKREAPHFMVVVYDIPRGCIGTYFPEANPLIPVNEFARKSETPVSKSIVVKMEKA
ncbi:MAG: molybdopterin-dependent oxidoreductase alpha subunit [Saprospiraceae bacterium]|jgi:molybdopterin-dependent oxidoreductase alpha subunit